MRAQVGDEIVVESQALGRVPRRGRVQEILGSDDTEHFRVRWEDGHESVYFPGAGGHIVRPVAGAVPMQAAGPRQDADRPLAELTLAFDRIGGHATLRATAALLARAGADAVVVQEPDSPPSLLTARDLLAALAAGADPDVVWVADIAPSATVWVARDEGLVRAAESMRDAGVTHALVRGPEGLMGVVALTDVLAAVVDAGSRTGITAPIA